MKYKQTNVRHCDFTVRSKNAKARALHSKTARQEWWRTLQELGF